LNRKRSTLKLAAAAALAVCALAPSASGRPLAAERFAANSATFQASLPEDAAAPAITTVAVSNGDNGLVTFRVGISNRSQLTNNDHYAVFLDTDSNASTGDTDAEGAEYAILVDSGRADLGRWNGSDFDFSVPQSSLVFTYASGPVLSFNAAELGGPTAFNFYVAALTDDPAGGDPHADFAPPTGHGTWNYQVKVTPLQLSFVKLTTTPTTPKAGQAFTVIMVIRGNKPDARKQGARAVCTASVARRSVKPAASGFANNTARCAWRLPRSVKGKTISGSVSATYQGLQVSHRFAARVR
jgi:hypothetical protein